jgi:hypothetical protein
VVGREKRDAPIGGFGGTSVTPQGESIVRLHLKYGEHETDIKGVAPGYWGRAAKDASDRAVRWIARYDGTFGSRKAKRVSSNLSSPVAGDAPSDGVNWFGTFTTPASVDNAYAGTLIDAALHGTWLSHS